MGRQFEGSMRGHAVAGLPPTAIAFVYRLAASPAFRDLFREGMTLVEEAAAYLDGPGRAEIAGPRPSGGARLCNRKHAPDHAPHAGRVVAPAPARGQRGRTDSDPGADGAASRQAFASGCRLRPRGVRAFASDVSGLEPPFAAPPGSRHPSRPELRHRPFAGADETALRGRLAARAIARGVFELRAASGRARCGRRTEAGSAQTGAARRRDLPRPQFWPHWSARLTSPQTT